MALDRLSQVTSSGLASPINIGIATLTSTVVGSAVTINSSGIDVAGIVTATTANFVNATISGDLTVEGTTTTLDTILTEVDKLEVGANNTTVGVAITQSGSGDILNLYDGSSEVFSVADGGAVTTSGDISVGGDLTLPDAIVHSGDTDTKIRFPATDTVTVETAGEERLRINSSGKVGIGTDNPSTNLHVVGSVRATGAFDLRDTAGNVVLFVEDASNDARISNQTAGEDIVIRTTPSGGSATERLRISSDGKILTAGAATVPLTSAGGIDACCGVYSVVIGGNSGGGSNQNQRTDGGNKEGRLVSAHKTNAEEPVSVATIFNLSTQNLLYFGGGSSLVNAATDIAFYTAANTTTTGGTERLRISSGGDLFVAGTGGMNTTQLNNGNTVNINGTSSNDGFSVIRYSTGYGAYGLNIGRSKSDTLGTNTAVTNGNDLGHITFYGADGTDFNEAAQITAQVDGTPSDGTDMPGRLVFKTSSDASATPAERLRITSGGNVQIANGNLVFSTSGTGIDFSANANATGMTSELLDDYEEGTWLPALDFNGGTTGITYGVRNGAYIKIGRLVMVRGGFVLTNKGTSSGTAYIGGFPFTVESISYADATAIGGSAGFSSINGAPVVVGQNAQARAILWYNTTSGGRILITQANFNNNTEIYFSMVYTVS